MPKIIKFDLPLDGIRAKNIEEIRDHFTLEILGHFRSGLLAKWLAVRKLQDEVAAVQALDGLDDHAVLKGLCGVFGVEADDAFIAEVLRDPTPKSTPTIAELMQQYEQIAESIAAAGDSDKQVIDLADVLPIESGAVKIIENSIVRMSPAKIAGDSVLIFKSCSIGIPIGFEDRYLDLGNGDVLDTQTGKMCKHCGQRYLDLGDGTVVDIRTGLQWMRCSLGQTWNGNTCTGSAETYKQYNAESAIRKMNGDGGYAGHKDWRLPSLQELKSLVYCSSGQPKKWNDTHGGCKGDYARPTIDLVAFPNAADTDYWSSSSGMRGGGVFGTKVESGYWEIGFLSGNADVEDSSYNYPRVRLVRGGQ
jgi:hypothetical protein